MKDILYLFHHIHHKNGEHIVHHCGNNHKKIDPGVDYIVEYCTCAKHRIDKKIALGHDIKNNKIEVSFKEKCPYDGWHIESGLINERK